MAELLVREVKAARSEMDQEICKIITKFENDTEMRVEDIHLRRDDTIGERSRVVQVLVSVTL